MSSGRYINPKSFTTTSLLVSILLDYRSLQRQIHQVFIVVCRPNKWNIAYNNHTAYLQYKPAQVFHYAVICKKNDIQTSHEERGNDNQVSIQDINSLIVTLLTARLVGVDYCAAFDRMLIVWTWKICIKRKKNPMLKKKSITFQCVGGVA